MQVNYLDTFCDEGELMNRKSVIVGTCVLIGLLIGWPLHQILLGVAIGLAVGYMLEAWTPLGKRRH